jgi:hypothetical protein
LFASSAAIRLNAALSAVHRAHEESTRSGWQALKRVVMGDRTWRCHHWRLATVVPAIRIVAE